MPWGEIIITAIAVAGIGSLSVWFVLILVATSAHNQAVRARLAEIEAARPWGEVIELHPEARRGATKTLAGEGAVRIAPTQSFARHSHHDGQGHSA
jgi:hypothetical protein